MAHDTLDSENGSMPDKEYTAGSITVLEGLQAVRERPGMYIGDTGVNGLHHLVYEVVDNCIDEAMAGYCTAIDIIIHKDGSISVEDNGRGIPVERHEKESQKQGRDVSALEVVMTILHAGGKFDKDTYKVSGGLHGVGISCVNALSKKMLVQVYKQGKIYEIEFSKGKVVRPIASIGETEKGEPESVFGLMMRLWKQPNFNMISWSNVFESWHFLIGESIFSFAMNSIPTRNLLIFVMMGDCAPLSNI